MTLDRSMLVPICGIQPSEIIRTGTAGQCGRRQPRCAGEQPVDVQSTAGFDSADGRASVPVIVDFWAAWCGVQDGRAGDEEGGENLPAVPVLKVDTDANANCPHVRHSSIPTIAVFHHGREVMRSGVKARRRQT